MNWRSHDYERPADSLVYWADCQLATVSDVYMRKSTSQRERERQARIAGKMLWDIYRYQDRLSAPGTYARQQVDKNTRVWRLIQQAKDLEKTLILEDFETLALQWGQKIRDQ